MMSKKPSFFYQTGVLIDRYFHIFFNDKKNLLLKIAIPLMTIIIVCVVACGDMFSIKPDDDHTINNGFPVLNWETVVQEKENDDKERELIEPSEVTVSKWNGEDSEMPTTPTKMDGEHYFLITNAAQLAFLSKAADTPGYEDYLTYNYLLQCDVNLKSKEFNSIGNADHPFTGTFDGNGHKISNLKIDSTKDNTGLFGYVSSDADAKSDVTVTNSLTKTELELTFYHNGVVKNLCVEKADISSDGKNTGIIVGCADKKARITSVCAKEGSVESKGNNLGGIIGSTKGEDVEIYICYSTATVKGKGENIGGIAGKLGKSRLSAAYVSAEVEYTGKDSGKKIGSVVGSCEDADEQLKNTVYNNEIKDCPKAAEDKDIAGVAIGITEKKLKIYSSFLIPFKDIMTEHELNNMSEKDEDRYDRKDYDVEKDKSIDDTYGFKKDAQLSIFNGTQTGLFMLVCVAIFVGICNSIQEICKERNILKREYMTNLRLSSYVVSKLVVQATVCAVQMLVVMLIFMLFVTKKQLPDDGIIFGSIWIEYFITMFLLAFAADTMSLLISSMVKTSEMANTFIPIILIVQIVFSGVLFEMKGILGAFAKLMISKWGINALAAITSLNDAQPAFLIENPSLQLQLGSSLSTIKAEYASTLSNLLMIWGILLAFIVVSSIACGIMLTRVKKDRR